MLKFDEERKILYAYKNDIGVGIDKEIEPNIDYVSFRRYIESQVKKDVMDIFLPLMHKTLKIDEFDLGIEDIRVEQVDEGYFDDTDYHVMVRWASPRNFNNHVDKGRNDYISIMRIPMVDEQGILYHDGNRYSLIKMLEQEETVSFDCSKAGEEKLKIKTSNAAIVFMNTSSGIKMELSNIKSKSSKKKFTAAFVMAAKVRDEWKDHDDYPLTMWEDFADYSIKKTIPDKNIMKALYFYGGNQGSIEASEYSERVVPNLRGYSLNSDGEVINYDSYCIKELRAELNEILSLKRALGRVLSRDVKSLLNKDQVIAHKGEQVSEAMIRRFNSQFVNSIYVQSIPNVEGLYLADTIPIDGVKKGTKIIPEIAEYLPDEKGMYVSKDTSFSDLPDHALWLWTGTQINMPLLNFIRESGIMSILVAKDQKGSSSETCSRLYLEEEVISNRHFTNDNWGERVTKADYDNIESWSYIDYNGNRQKAQEYLTAADIQAIISLFAKLCRGMYRNVVTNTDTGFRKKLILCDALYHRCFYNACKTAFANSQRALKSKWKDPSIFFNKDEMDNAYYPFSKNFFKYLRDDSKALRPLIGDVTTNPIAFQSALTKINTYVKDKNSVADEQRRIAIGSYSRTDAYETPQSGKMGTVLNLAIGCKVTPEGKMLAPYFKVKWGKVGKPTVDLSQKHYLSVQQEERFIIGDISSLLLDEKGTIKNKDDYILCRVPSTNSIDKHTFSYVSVTEIEYVNADPNQSLSWATAAIPCLGCNDAARTIFGIAQAKEAKGLVNPDIPYVMTKSNLMIPRLTDEYAFIALEDGVVVDSSIIVKERDKKKNSKRDLGKIWISVRYDSQSEDEGVLKSWPETSSTKYSMTVRRILKKPGDRFKKGEVLMTSNYVVDGILAMGKNALVGYIPTGYNYEDGANISAQFCNNLLSYRENHEEFPVASKSGVVPYISNSMSGRWITAGSDSAFNIRWKAKASSEGSDVKCIPKKAFGFLESWNILTEKDSSTGKKRCTGVDVTLTSIDTFGSGDKDANRHGNKGVCSEPFPTELMPRLLNGVPLDVAYNPLGVISRMNIGQIEECHITLPAGIIGYYVYSDPYNGITSEEVAVLLKFCHDLANSTEEPASIGRRPEFDIIPENFKNYAYRKIDAIRFWAGVFDERGEAYFLIPDNGMKMTETKGLIGFNDVFKMIQESEKKVHVRGGMMTEEPYALVSGAPTEGASNHGGQRYGTMEMDALCAYGASAFVQECLNECGDNATARSNLNVDVFAPSSIKDMYTFKHKGQRRSVTNFLYSMAAMGLICEPEEDEFIPLSSDNCNQLVSYTKNAISNIKVNSYEEKSNESGSNNSGPVSKLEELMNDAEDVNNLSLKDLMAEIKKG